MKYTRYEEAIKQYTDYTGETPEWKQIENLYYEYRKVSRHFDSFLDWFTYYHG